MGYVIPFFAGVCIGFAICAILSAGARADELEENEFTGGDVNAVLRLVRSLSSSDPGNNRTEMPQMRKPRTEQIEKE